MNTMYNIKYIKLLLVSIFLKKLFSSIDSNISYLLSKGNVSIKQHTITMGWITELKPSGLICLVLFTTIKWW